ncbi:MAG: FAD-dependent oxidoreductase, partial [Planctomycetes bacterium]|nr:FAD-dependent oxidoreductase [Planctomycetota bacterium]
MTSSVEDFDICVIGGGPAGQKAAIQGVKSGQRVVVIEREPKAGGACVRRGTIPSKTLHETASLIQRLSGRSQELFSVGSGTGVPLPSLMMRVEEVVEAHESYMTDQLLRNGVTLIHGSARFRSTREIEVTSPGQSKRRLRAEIIVIASGSSPRQPTDVHVDHENVLDSDSILALGYLPSSLVVIGSGVIASEYASIFAVLGVDVTMVDRFPMPLGFLDPELTSVFVEGLEANGGRFLGNRRLESITWDGLSQVITRLDDGTELRSEKLLYALGRVANLSGLGLAGAGLQANERGLLSVDADFRTEVPNIFAIGDVICPLVLAATAMEQGRFAVCAALGLQRVFF